MSTTRAAARLRKQLLAKPGFTRLPVCPHCLKEIPLLEYAAHTRECEKASQQPPPAAQVTVNGANGASPAPQDGLVYALFDARAAARLEKAGAEILCLRQELHEQHDTLTSTDRVQRCQQLAQRECLMMAIVIAQLRRRFALQGSGAVFIRGIRPHIIDEHFRGVCTELVRMSDPSAWSPSA